MLLSLAAGALLLVGDAPVRATATPRADDGGPGLSIRTIESSLGAEGAQDFVIVFDGPVPDDRISYVEDITDVEAPALAYTTQEWRPETPTSLWTCGAGHGGFSPPPPVVGQLDVLIPGDWFRAPPEPDEIVWEQRTEGQALKTPLCGPHDGYVQFAIWSPASHDPADIRVYLDGRTRLVVEIRPGSG